MQISDEIIKLKKGEVEYIQIKKFLDENINHAFFLKHGGVSENEYASLNFRSIGKDSIENVLENLKIAGVAAGFNYSNTVYALQDHTDISKVIDKENLENYLLAKRSKEPIDALITNEKNIPLLVTTADCTPIIVLDKKQKIIANIHAGWKGTVKKIHKKTIEKMIEKYGTNPEDILIGIGPCIRFCCWTTEDETLIKDLETIWNTKYIEKIDKKYHVNFIKCIKLDLEDLGILKENIIDTNICTCCNNNDFFSFRYNTMNKIKEFGTEATIIEK